MTNRWENLPAFRREIPNPPPPAASPQHCNLQHIDHAEYLTVKAERDRYIARCAELEKRLEQIREVLK